MKLSSALISVAVLSVSILAPASVALSNRDHASAAFSSGTAYSLVSRIHQERVSRSKVVEVPETVIIAHKLVSAAKNKKVWACEDWRNLVQGSGYVRACEYK